MNNPVSKNTNIVDKDDQINGKIKSTNSLNGGQPSNLADSNISTGTRAIAPLIKIVLLEKPVHIQYTMIAEVAVFGFIKKPSGGTLTPIFIKKAAKGLCGNIILEYTVVKATPDTIAGKK